MNRSKNYIIVSLSLFLIVLIGFCFVRPYLLKTYFKKSPPPIVMPDIPTPDGWIGNRDGNTHAVFVDATTKNPPISGQIVVDAVRMDRPLPEWINAYMKTVSFDPVQTCGTINGHLVLVTHEDVTSSLKYYIFNNDTVYTFWFGSYRDWEPPVVNIEGRKTVETMIEHFIEKL